MQTRGSRSNRDAGNHYGAARNVVYHYRAWLGVVSKPIQTESVRTRQCYLCGFRTEKIIDGAMVDGFLQLESALSVKARRMFGSFKHVIDEELQHHA